MFFMVLFFSFLSNLSNLNILNTLNILNYFENMIFSLLNMRVRPQTAMPV